MRGNLKCKAVYIRIRRALTELQAQTDDGQRGCAQPHQEEEAVACQHRVMSLVRVPLFQPSRPRSIPVWSGECVILLTILNNVWLFPWLACIFPPTWKDGVEMIKTTTLTLTLSQDNNKPTIHKAQSSFRPYQQQQYILHYFPVIVHLLTKPKVITKCSQQIISNSWSVQNTCISTIRSRPAQFRR